MSRLNMVRKIKDSKKEPNKKQDEREKGWDDRFIYNKLEDNIPEKKPISKKNDYTSNINYLKQQFNNDKINQRKSTKKRGKSGYKFIQEKNNSNIINKNKIRIKSNDILKYNNLVDLNNTDNSNNNEILSLIGEKKIGIIGNDNNITNKNNNSTNFIRNNNYININNTSNIYNNMSLDEIEVYVGILWNKLGVKDTYQKTFNEVKEEKENEEAKKEFMILEIQNLEKMEKFLKELSSLIENRDKTILLLKKITEIMDKQFISINLDIKESLINDFYKEIIEYRKNTIKVIEDIELFNQLFSYNVNKGKFDEDILVRKSKLFDKENNIQNYLLKIKDDLNFLGYSKVNGHKQLNLNFKTSNDPFLLSALEQVPFNLDDYNRIKQCQYIIMQEVIFESMNSRMDNKNNNGEPNILDYASESSKKKKLEPIINHNNSSVISNNNSKIVKNENNNRNNNNDDRKRKENNKIKKTEKIVIETQLIDKNNYENFFGNKNPIEESDDQMLEKLKTELNAVNVFNKYKKENSKIQIDSMNNNNISNKNRSNDNLNDKIYNDKQLEKTKKNEDIENNSKNIIITDNKENEGKKDINKFHDNNNKNQEKIEVIKEDIKNEEKSENMNLEKIEDKDNNEDFVNIDENININEEQNKINYNNGNKDNNIEDNILENSLVISKKINPTKEHNRSSTPKSLRNSKIITTKEMNQNQKNNLNKDNNISEVKNEIIIQSNRDNDYIAFYCGKISNFVSIYSSYYNTIPEEQKIIFNLKPEPVEYFHNNFFPKIIIYSDKKTRTIKGLCIFSFIFTNESKNNGIFIEHISSYNEEEREKIFEKLFSYIKENSYNLFGFENNRKDKEIYIDLYYKNEDGKFKINTEIRDFFRNQLKFKWVKLENLSKYVRYQKMRHQFMINSDNNNENLLNNEYDDNNILNQSILGRKEFNNDENDNESEGEEESEDEEINTDISRIFDKDNFNDKESIDIPINDNINNAHSHNKFNLLNNFSIKNKTVLKFNKKSYINKNKDKDNKKSLTYIKYSNPFNFIYLLKKINDNLSYDNISSNIEYYFNKKDSNIINQILQKSFNLENVLKEDNFYYSDINELKNKSKSKFKVNSNINILPIFDSCISFKYKNYYYNRVQLKKVQTFIDTETQQTFYMVDKNENHILLISSSLNEKFKQKYTSKENKDNISINFINIYNNLVDLDNKDKNNDKDKNILFIPAFEIKSKLVNNCYCNANDQKYTLNCFEDYYNIKYLTEELMSAKNNKNIKRNKNYNGNASMNFDYDLIKEIDSDKQNFIDDKFLLVILNLNIIEKLRALPLLTLYITKENFISA